MTAAWSYERCQSVKGITIGSGPHYAADWCNTDIMDPPEGHRKPDLFVSVYELGKVFPFAAFKKCYLGHVLEHLEWDDIPRAFDQICEVTQSGAQVMAVGPCIVKAAAMAVPEWLVKAIIADPRTEHNGADHAWTPTEELTLEAMERGGLKECTVVSVVGVAPPEWPNPSTVRWQCAVTGIVP